MHLRVPQSMLDGDNAIVVKSSTAPLSGTAGTGAGLWAAPGCLLRCTANGVLYLNEGTLASPYWTPVDFRAHGLIAYASDFRAGLGKALSDSNDAEVIADGTGLRVHGQGVAENDSGLTVAFAEGGPVASLVTTDEAAHLAAISQPGTSPQFQPDTHGPLVIDAEIAMSAAITLRSLFLGWLGTIADALDPAVTGSTVTATLVQDDLAGVVFDVGFTDADRLYAVHNKSDEAATQDVTAGGRDTGADFPAAGTYTRLRVEIARDGVMTVFKDKAQIAQISAALDVDEEVAPSLYVRSTSAAVKTMLVKRFAAWGSRA
ncbi:MAG: hypothetical protein AB7Q29_14835 [Vicinamibacterales bacterium]